MPSGFEGLLAGRGGNLVDEEKVLDPLRDPLPVLCLDETCNRADEPPAAVFQAVLFRREITDLSVRDGGTVPIAMLLGDGEGF